MARNKAMDALRRRHLAKGNEDTMLDNRPDPAAECDRRMTQVRVRTVLAGLSKRVSETNFQVLYLRWIESRNIAEIAEILGLTPEPVRFRLYRMKKKFRELFERSIERGTTDENSGQR